MIIPTNPNNPPNNMNRWSKEENETINDPNTAVGGDTEKEREIPENTGK